MRPHAVTQATGEELGQTALSVFLLGDSVQREAVDTTFELFTPEALDPNSAITSEVLQQSAETLRNLNPLQDGGITLQELRNKFSVFQLVIGIPKKLNLSSQPPYSKLIDVINEAYKLEEYPALWAVEGLGHWYGDTFWNSNRVPQGILRDENITSLPDKSFTMLNAEKGHRPREAKHGFCKFVHNN